MVKNLPWLPFCTLPITSSHPVSKDHCQILLLPIHILGAFSISLWAWLLKGGCSRAKGIPHFPGQIPLTVLTEKRVKFQFLSTLTHKAFLTWLPPLSLSHHISPVCPEAPSLKSSLCFYQQMLQQSELVHRVFTFHKMPLPPPFIHPLLLIPIRSPSNTDSPDGMDFPWKLSKKKLCPLTHLLTHVCLDYLPFCTSLLACSSISSVSSVQSLSRVRLFATPGLQHARPPCPSPTPRVYSNSCPLSRWCHPNISSSVLSPSPPAFNLSQHQGLFRWVSSSHQVAKILEFQLQHQSFQWIFRTHFL